MTVNDESLEVLLKAADASAALPPDPRPDLADRVRDRHEESRRRRRRIHYLAASAAGYLAGLLTMWLWAGNHSFDATPGHGPGGGLSGRPDSPTIPDPPAIRALRERDPLRPGLADGQKLLPNPNPYDRLRRLGDEYLLQRGDVQLAVEFYSRALNALSEEELAISDEDTWLLISLKRDRLITKL